MATLPEPVHHVEHGGRTPLPFGQFPRAPRAVQTPNIIDVLVRGVLSFVDFGIARSGAPTPVTTQLHSRPKLHKEVRPLGILAGIGPKSTDFRWELTVRIFARTLRGNVGLRRAAGR